MPHIEIDDWIDALCALDAEAWRALGRFCINGSYALRTRDAQRVLAGILSRDLADVDAWMLRDQVETICHVATAGYCDTSRTVRRDLLAARDAAQCATLAIAFGDRIPPADVALLCAPFTAVLPRSTVRGA